MKTWFLIDDCTRTKGQVFAENTWTSDRKKALRYAMREWEAMSDHDRESRDWFYIALAYANEDGSPDYDSIYDTVTIK